MMLFDKTRRPAVAVLGIAMLAGLLPLSGCSDSSIGSSSGTGDKKNDPALKALSQEKLEIYKPKSHAIKGNPLAGGKRRS
jgi:hypothetical protein